MRPKLHLYPIVPLSIGVVLVILASSDSQLEVTAECVPNSCAQPPCCNGDVNGDSAIDISDAVFLLSHLFLGGPPPAAISSGDSQIPESLPQTGQTLCYGGSSVLECGSTEFPGQDGLLQAGCPKTGRFLLNDDGTVTDTCTGLVWEQSGSSQSTWAGALHHCDSLLLGEYDDWRLPNVRELQSLLDYGRWGPAIDTSIFSCMSDWYWSSTSAAGLVDSAWAISFGPHGGGIVREQKSASYWVRAVRGGL